MEASSNKKGVRSDINVTPLVDIVLVLLIIFMVLTPSMLKHLSALVPKKPEDSTPPPADAAIVVEYTAARELTVNTEPVSPEALAEKLTTRLRSARQKVIFFKAEDGAPYGDVVRLMDIARGAGAESLAVVTRAPQ
jgi:biopolymer transport protein TolR